MQREQQVEAQQVEESNRAADTMAASNAHDLMTSEYEFVVEGVQSLREDAWSKRDAVFESERFYLRGYCLSAEAMLEGRNELFRVLISLHDYDMHPDVQWPGKEKLKLRILHPKGGPDRELKEDTRDLKWPSMMGGDEIEDNENEEDTIWTGKRLPLWALIHHGYVEDDQLRVKLELLP